MKEKTTIPLIFDICLISTLGILIILPSLSSSFMFSSSIDFVFLTLAGILMISSNRLKSISRTGKGFYWFALNVIKPRSKYNHIIWGLFLLGFGVLAAFDTLKGHAQLSEKEIAFHKEVQASYEFWIGIAVVLLFNILVGVYTAKKHKSDNNTSAKSVRDPN